MVGNTRQAIYVRLTKAEQEQKKISFLMTEGGVIAAQSIFELSIQGKVIWISRHTETKLRERTKHPFVKDLG